MTSIESDNPGLLARDKPYFNAILHPYRSMGRSGFFWLIAIVGLVMLVVSLVFFLLGAWPIVGFAGLDILLLYWAFRRNFAEARTTEQISITHRDVTVTRTSPRGETQQFAFNPYWVRLSARHEADKGMTELLLTSHGQHVEIGAFLHACERESLAQALKSALSEARQFGAQVSGG